jgi:NAD(P)H-dependent flavin oxidoreductase YrpB (nitropropane dioxygenase family)
VLDEWLVRIKEGLDADGRPERAPFAVNLIVHGSNERLSQDLATCVRHEVPILITSLRPPGEVVAAADIVYTDAASGLHGNYLAPSLRAAGIDPSPPAEHASSSGYAAPERRSKAWSKAWRDIWGAGQGVGSIADIPSVAQCVARLEREYCEAHARLRTMKR